MIVITTSLSGFVGLPGFLRNTFSETFPSIIQKYHTSELIVVFLINCAIIIISVYSFLFMCVYVNEIFTQQSFFNNVSLQHRRTNLCNFCLILPSCQCHSHHSLPPLITVFHQIVYIILPFIFLMAGLPGLLPGLL